MNKSISVSKPCRQRGRGLLLLGVVALAAFSAAPGNFCGPPRSPSRQLQRSLVAARAEEGGPLVAVQKSISDFTKDDGRILDEGTPAGAIGSIAIALVVLPYVPVSLFSSWALLTTGSGIDPGPGGLYGLIEGISSLGVLAVCGWSFTSFLTRARGLPAGTFRLLGTTQALCWFCILCFAAATVLNATENPFLNKTPEEITEIAQVKLKEAGGELEKQATVASEQAKIELEKQIKDIKPESFNPSIIAETLKGAAAKVQIPSAAPPS